MTADADLRKWFSEHTHRAMKNRLEDGSDLDVEQYVSHYIDLTTGEAVEPRIFRDLLPSSRDVTTALLLDGSSSLGVHGGRIFKLELACADALSQAMTLARERHGIFVFTGNTRHRVEVTCLKEFEDRRFVPPGGLGLATGGYTRLGAPLRHMTSRLLDQPSERRLLIVIGDGLISDEGYEGRYAWADAAHAVEEANEAGVSMYYVGVGPTRVDPLPEVFGPRRSQRIRRIEELPRVWPMCIESWWPRDRNLLLQRQRSSVVRAGVPPAPAGDAHRPDRLREDTTGRAHGPAAAPSRRDHQLPRRSDQLRSRRAIHGDRW